MTALLLVAGLVVRLVLAAVILAAVAATCWVVWDCFVGPSARLAAAHRAREVHGHGS